MGCRCAIAIALLCSLQHLVPSLAIHSGASCQDRIIRRTDTTLNGVICPDAFTCIPAPCDVEHSNGEPGLDCRCKDGFTGTITWSGPNASGDCQPAPCHVEHSNKEPGLACRCLDSFEGAITWSGTMAGGECIAAPCDVEHSNRKRGLACQCLDGFEGQLRWSGPAVSGECKAAPCYVEHSSKEPGPACKCSDGFEGDIAWSGPRATGECSAAPCGVEHSNREPGLGCRCSDGNEGEVAWNGPVATGSCRPAPCDVPYSNHEPGPACSCRDTAVGRLRWVGPEAVGRCDPAPCHVENSNRLHGKACTCDDYSEGPPIQWKAGKASGKCQDRMVEVIHLLDAKSVLRLGDREFKCCASSRHSGDPKIVDLGARPSERKYGHRSGCGRMFGDTWHGAHRSGSCKVKLGEMAAAMNISRDELVGLVGRRPAPPESRVVEMQPGKGFSCAETCGYLGGTVDGVAEAGPFSGPAPASGSEKCSCELGPAAGLHPKWPPAAAPSPGGDLLPLRAAPFLMTHDSATGYIGDHDILHQGVAKTQWLDLVEQLDCGARALDIRLVAKGGDSSTVHYHHTSCIGGSCGHGWVSDQTLAGTLPGIVDWSASHPEELVLLVVSHCYTSTNLGVWSEISCLDDRISQAFADLGVKVQTSCHSLSEWTLQQAKAFATLEGGGQLLAVPGEGGCVEANYDPSVKSSEAVRPYVERTMASAPQMGTPFQVQSFIQQTLEVPVSAELNKDIYSWLTTSNLYDGVNLLEVNLACGYSTSISSVLGATITSEDEGRCIVSCQRACLKKGACQQ